MKIACIQLDVAFAEPEKNFSNVQKYIEKVASEGAELVVLPEMWNTAYALTELEHLADVEGQRTKKFLSEFSPYISRSYRRRVGFNEKRRQLLQHDVCLFERGRACW